jgi:hypothetical protein
MSTAMMAMTTRSSISVNPRRDVDLMGWSSRGDRMDENQVDRAGTAAVDGGGSSESPHTDRILHAA